MTTAASRAIHSPTIPGPDPAPHPPRVPFPRDTCDCHAHVLGPQRRFPYLPNAACISPDALPQGYAAMLRTLGCERAVLVLPSVYGTDNHRMVAATTSGAFNSRSVA